MRRDLQQTFTALTDAAILIAGRVVETAGWMRKLDVVTTNGETDSLFEKLGDDEKRLPQVLNSQAHDVRLSVRYLMPSC